MAQAFSRELAKLHLDLAHALFSRREAREMSVESVAEKTGLPVARIMMIEEGDTTSLTEIALLCHALDARLQIDPGFEVRLIPVHETRLRWLDQTPRSELRTATFTRATIHAQSDPLGAFDHPLTSSASGLAHARD